LRLTRIALSVATTVVVALAFAVAAAGSASTKLDFPPTHFAGFPPEGVKASTPTTGRLLIGLSRWRLKPWASTTWNVYADGRVVWQKWTSAGDATVVPDGARRLDTGYVQQRLTPEGVQLLLSKILATGLFEQDLMLDVGGHLAWVYQVWRGDRMVRVNGQPSPDPSWNLPFTKATTAQIDAAAWIEKLLANPARLLPTGAWANRQIRAFVPARYVVAFDRSSPVISKLPAPAGRVLVRYKPLLRHGCQVMTTWNARVLLQAFVEAGLSPSDNHALTIAFGLPGLHGPSDFHMSPALPDNAHC
jgi:hypothetical protein